MKKNTEHLNNLLNQAVEFDRRNDAAARNRCEFEAVKQYALCSQATWDKKFKALAEK